MCDLSVIYLGTKAKSYCLVKNSCSEVTFSPFSIDLVGWEFLTYASWACDSMTQIRNEWPPWGQALLQFSLTASCCVCCPFTSELSGHCSPSYVLLFQFLHCLTAMIWTVSFPCPPLHRLPLGALWESWKAFRSSKVGSLPSPQL